MSEEQEKVINKSVINWVIRILEKTLPNIDNMKNLAK